MSALIHLTHRSPLVIGGTGGSGTRVLRSALAAAGVFMGERLNESGDAMDFEPFLDDAINPILARTASLDYGLGDLPAGLTGSIRRQFAGALAVYVRDRPRGKAWGWKNPRSMYVLPVILDRCPGMRFIHMVRDGRDMAVSTNQNQARKHYEALFGHPLHPDSTLASIELLQKANLDVAAWCRRRLGERHRLVRFEDLCAQPAQVLNGILRWIRGGSGAPAHTPAAAISAPSSLGRWRSLPLDQLAILEDAARRGLREFGYLADPPSVT